MSIGFRDAINNLLEILKEQRTILGYKSDGEEAQSEKVKNFVNNLSGISESLRNSVEHSTKAV